MRVLLATMGSAGDVNPYIAVGRALRARGHEVLLLSSGYFEHSVRQAGLAFEPLGTREEYLAAIRHPHLVHATRGPRFVIQELIITPAREHFARTREVIRSFCPDVGLRHLISFGPAWALEHEGVPTATASLTPLFWFSRVDPGVFKHAGPLHTPWVLRRARLELGRIVARLVFDPGIQRARRDMGLPRLRRGFIDSMLGSRGPRLGLWSTHFRGAVSDDPEGGRICGFCFHDEPASASAQRAEEAARLEAFLGAGPAPIVFTLGTSVVHHAGGFFDLASHVARALGRRAVLLTGPPEAGSLSPASDEHVHCTPYAPFSSLLPRAAAVVHHVGIGTTAQALRAGTPQVCVPFANDEFDNASRAARLGVARVVHARYLQGDRLAQALDRVLKDHALQALARALAAAVSGEDGAGVAAAALEEMGRGRLARD